MDLRAKTHLLTLTILLLVVVYASISEPPAPLFADRDKAHARYSHLNRPFE
ncbi:hypothetical protein BS17DRAFT_881280 [Gyrodon lividus]|nr:hypothetical protein BS17DRAFT_881280 [Gyrodon lividus]